MRAKLILNGKTDTAPLEVMTVMEDFAEEYRGNAYNLIAKNCSHFCNDACIRLTAKSNPQLDQSPSFFFFFFLKGLKRFLF